MTRKAFLDVLRTSSLSSLLRKVSPDFVAKAGVLRSQKSQTTSPEPIPSSYNLVMAAPSFSSVREPRYTLAPGRARCLTVAYPIFYAPNTHSCTSSLAHVRHPSGLFSHIYAFQERLYFYGRNILFPKEISDGLKCFRVSDESRVDLSVRCSFPVFLKNQVLCLCQGISWIGLTVHT